MPTTEVLPEIPVRKIVDPNNTVTGSLDAQSRMLAKWLHETAYVYALYGLLDGLSLSYSMVKYSFDVLVTKNDSSDLMHDWMMTPEGISTVSKFSVTLIGFSLLANIFSDKDENAFKRYIAISWPYVRDTLKGLKNAYKGIRSAFQAISVLSGQDLKSMIIPVGIVLGVISVVNRLFMRGVVVEPRKLMMGQNAELLKEIKAFKLTEQDSLEAINAIAQACQEKLGQIKSQTKTLRAFALLGASYGGVVDGLYLYMGAMGLAVLSPPAFLAMLIFSTLFTAAGIATRIYEEYDYQRKLVATAAQIELAVCGKELEVIFAKIQRVPTITAETDIEKEIEKLKQQLDAKMKDFEAKRDVLRAQTTLSYTSAALVGLKNGLAAYGAVASVLFAIAIINTMVLAPFSAALMVVGITIGIVFLIGFLAHALINNYNHLHTQVTHESPHHIGLERLLEDLKQNSIEVTKLEPAKVEKAVLGGEFVDSSPPYTILEYSEIGRSIGSGAGKGGKAAEYMLNPLEEKDTQGHYHESPLMLIVAAFFATANAIVLGLRALARGLGRPQLGIIIEVPEDEPEVVPEEGTTRLRENTPLRLSESPGGFNGSDDEDDDFPERPSSANDPRSSSPMPYGRHRHIIFSPPALRPKSVDTLPPAPLNDINKVPGLM